MSRHNALLVLFGFLWVVLPTEAFSSLVDTQLTHGISPRPCTSSRFKQNAALRMVSSSLEENVETATTGGLLKRDRYVATNRFAVRRGKEAKFEARWANRKSQLANCDGFKHFHLMRRVTLDEDTSTYNRGNDKEDALGNYVSFTIWDQKSHFSKWRKGEAFKEAHGGTSIGAFVSTMVNSFRVLQGPPRPAFYDGLLVQSVVLDSLPTLENGWRSVQADGTETLPTECFVACNQFFVPAENSQKFEQRWAQRESKLKECDGFVAFMLNRRDVKQKGHGTSPMSDKEPTYVTTTIWQDRQAFENWKSSQAFAKAHGNKSKPNDSNEKSAPQPPLWSRPPEPVFYEGTLVITTPNGA